MAAYGWSMGGHGALLVDGEQPGLVAGRDGAEPGREPHPGRVRPGAHPRRGTHRHLVRDRRPVVTSSAGPGRRDPRRTGDRAYAPARTPVATGTASPPTPSPSSGPGSARGRRRHEEVGVAMTKTAETKTQYYTATTIDGFIADEHHSLEWLFAVERSTEQPDGFTTFYAEVGAMAMGRRPMRGSSTTTSCSSTPRSGRRSTATPPAGSSRIVTCRPCRARTSVRARRRTPCARGDERGGSRAEHLARRGR